MNSIERVDQVFGILGQIVAAGGGGAVVAFLLFQYLGKSWLEKQLAKDLELAKAEIGLIMARKLKMYDREFVVFPRIWSKLNKAYGSLGRAVVSLREIPNFARLSPDELESWLDGSDLTDSEKHWFTKEGSSTAALCKILDWRDLLTANRDYIDFHQEFMAEKIFLSPDLKEKLEQIAELMRSSWVDRKMDMDGHQGRDFLVTAYKTYNEEAGPVVSEIEEIIRAKFHPADKS
jgi:hypothetical protein